MGKVYTRGKKLWLTYTDLGGERRRAPTDFRVGQEEQAEALLELIEGRLAAGKDAGADLGPLTVAGYLPRWIESRKRLTAEWSKDQQRMTDHVVPVIGKMRLDAVRPRHLVELFAKLRQTHAPRTVHNIYSVVRAFFKTAGKSDLISGSPCTLDVQDLGKKVDKVKGWRAKAVYARAEVEQLLADPRVPFDRQVFIALQVIGGMRHGEAAPLTWADYDTELEPLGMLLLTKSNEREGLKVGEIRVVPVHPTLAAMLAEWRLSGWPAMMGRTPKPADLMVPLPKSQKGEAGRMRKPVGSLKKLHRDLDTLGLRNRRGHDLRRTFISLARGDGARKDIIQRITHKPPAEVMEGYTTFEWEVLCQEMLKLRIHRATRGAVVPLPVAVGDIVGHSSDTEEKNPADFAGLDARGRGLERATLPRIREVERSHSEPGDGKSGACGDGGGGEPPSRRAGADPDCAQCAQLRCPQCFWVVDLSEPVEGRRHGKCVGCRLPFVLAVAS